MSNQKWRRTALSAVRSLDQSKPLGGLVEWLAEQTKDGVRLGVERAKAMLEPVAAAPFCLVCRARPPAGVVAFFPNAENHAKYGGKPDYARVIFHPACEACMKPDKAAEGDEAVLRWIKSDPSAQHGSG